MSTQTMIVGTEPFELDSTDPGLAPGATENLPGIIESAIKLGRAAGSAVEKAAGASFALAREFVAAMLLFVDGDGFPVLNRKNLAEQYVKIEDAVYATAFPTPDDTPANTEKRATMAEKLRRTRNAVKVELSRDAIEEAIVNYCLDNLTPPLTEEENKALSRGAWTAGYGHRPAKLNTEGGKVPDRLKQAIHDLYTRNELKIPTNLGGTKTIGSGGGRGHTSSSPGDIGQFVAGVDSGKVGIIHAATEMDRAATAVLRQSLSPDHKVGAERDKVAAMLKIASDKLLLAGKVHTDAGLTPAERAKAVKLAGEPELVRGGGAGSRVAA